MSDTSLWFSDYNKAYTGTEPYFYPTENIDIARELEKQYPAIREELKILWEQKDDPVAAGFGAYDSFDDKQFPRNSWQKMVFKVWGLQNSRICTRFPTVAALMNRFPAVTSCFVTKTAPPSVIRPHCGETNGQIRIHLGLHVPAVSPAICGMEVGDQTTGWQNGKTFAFLDAHSHHVWNNSPEDRYVLIMDMIRPEFMHRTSFICSRVIVSQVYFYTICLLRITPLLKIPSRALDLLTWIAYIPIRIATALHNRFNIIKL